ncbi:MAG TPA: FtsW/RodA/SpoVE family cell cycle protein [Phycisphaerales bacterium]|nr:FtsW/RodA/SpoVE family cell cycle protein [Phycisphaerales bacterium]
MPRTFFSSLTGRTFNPWHGAWLCVLGGLGLSLLGIYAIDVAVADAPPLPGEPVTMAGLVLRQTIFLLVGLVAAVVVAIPHYRWVRVFAWPLMWAMIALLIFLLIPFIPASIVHPRNGARSWIELGPIDFQPGELAKVAFVLVMADYLRFRQNHRTIPGLIPPAVIAFIPAALIALQPDLGMALLFAPAIFAMLLVAGAKIRHMALVVVIAMLAAPASYPLLKPHQRARIDGMIQMVWGSAEKSAAAASSDSTFQARVARMLAGAGELEGVPDAKARVLHKYNALPERHNDMILSVIMTRFGLYGGLAVLGLYGLWFLGAYITAATCKDAFGQLVVVGLTAILFAQTFINVGMVVGILPITGLTLPFISYGGTSLVTVWVVTGLVFSIAMRRAVISSMAPPSFEFKDEKPTYGEPRPQPKIVPSRRRGGRHGVGSYP